MKYTRLGYVIVNMSLKHNSLCAPVTNFALARPRELQRVLQLYQKLYTTTNRSRCEIALTIPRKPYWLAVLLEIIFLHGMPVAARDAKSIDRIQYTAR